MSQDLSNATLFEVSWEVCNKVGGIYAVVSSKILEALAAFGENYFLLGPDLGNNPDFEETDEPCWQELRQETDRRNLSCRLGRWNIPGRPKVILVGYRDRYDQSQLLFSLWNRYGVDSISGGWDYVEPVMFSTACGEVIEAACKALHIPADGPALAHFHEWMCGGGLLYLKTNAPYVGTVFTTHATMLGRSMAGSGFDIYKQMHQINPKHEAGAYNITAKCSMETASAREADCFTTVSRITADEAGVFLGRTPDVLTLNGLDLRVIPDYSRDRSLAAASRQRLLEAAGRLLRRRLPEDTRIFLVSGRYEYHNKGIDVFLDALGMVNTALSQSQSNVLALCAVMGGHSGVNADAVSGDPAKLPGQGGFWISSHHVYNQPNDPILNACQRLGLDNRPENHVQVIFDPALLDGKDGFLNMRYEEVLAACDLGVFPSWYEPWGYTPHESAAYSVPTVTTDLSGFGLWIRQLENEVGPQPGIGVIARRNNDYSKTTKEVWINAKGYSSNTNYLVWINRAYQHVNVFTGSKGSWKLTKSFVVGTGAPGTETPVGVTKVTYKLKAGWTTSTYTVRPVVGFYPDTGYAFHSRLCTPKTDKEYDFSSGYPVSHGCVRMQKSDINWIYDNVPIGSTVVIF